MKPEKTIKELFESDLPLRNAMVAGWIKTRRDLKTFSFAEISDGSARKNLQIVMDAGKPDLADIIPRLTVGTAVLVKGDLVESPNREKQKCEMCVEEIKLLGASDSESYPIQKKKTSDEFLRTMAHLRPRTNKYASMLRIRSELSFAIHRYFRDRGFFQVHTPVITASDCEGAGQMFSVTAMDMENIPKTPDGKTDYSRDLFGKKSHLTVSGQLEGETLALALGRIYTFGPTFRAENSNTYRHCAEFWMVEPEMAFYDLEDNMDLAEDFVRSVTRSVTENCGMDLELFSRFLDRNLPATLENVSQARYERISYSDAVKILEKENSRFETKVFWGTDLASEHERFLTEKYFKKPVILHCKPRSGAAFYMKLDDDGRTARSMDLLVPRIGEIIGGSERENRLEVLEKRMEEMKIDKDDYWWYLDLRKFGSAPHSGFGLGFERMVMLLTSISNIRDVCAYPRVPGYVEF